MKKNKKESNNLLFLLSFLLIFCMAGIGSFFVQSAQAAVYSQGQTTAIEFYDTDYNGSVDTLRLYIYNTNGTTWTAGTAGSSLHSWQDTNVDGTPDAYYMGRTIMSINIIGSASANPVVVDIGMNESEWGMNTDLDGWTHVEYDYAQVGMGNGGIDDGVTELNTIVDGDDSTPSSDEVDKAAPQIRAFNYHDNDADGKIDAIVLELTEGAAAGSNVSPNDLLVTNVGDFTGLIAGSDTTNYFGSPGTLAATMHFATESSVIDTYDDSGNFAISTQNAFSVKDTDNNTNNTLGAKPQALKGDYAKPFLKSFTSTTLDSTYGPGSNINITATYSENLGTPSNINVTLNNGGTANLNNVSGATVYANYTVGATGSGQQTGDLTVSSKGSESVRDIYTYSFWGSANIRTNSSVPGASNNLGDSSDIAVDTVAPEVFYVFSVDTDQDGDIDAVDVDFTEPIDDSSLSFSKFVLDNDTTRGNGSEESCSSGSTTVRYQTLVSVVDDGKYRFMVNNGIPGTDVAHLHVLASAGTDLYGNQIASGDNLGTDFDRANPIIISTTPLSNAKSVSATADLVVTFSERMEPDGTSPPTVLTGTNPGNWVMNWSSGDAVANYSHDPFTKAMDYNLEFNGHDFGGLVLVGNTLLPFKTSTGGASGLTANIYPTSASVLINSGSATTYSLNVSLKLQAADAIYYMVSNYEDFHDASWEDFATPKTLTWNLLNDTSGEKKVYAKFKSSTGHFSDVVFDTIDYQPEETIQPEEEGEEGEEEIAPVDGLEFGDLIKLADSSTVYYYATDGKRYPFPTASVYLTWYDNFSGVKVISSAQLAAIALGNKNITYKPGVRMVKITTDPKVYAVDLFGVLRWIQTEELAEGLYGEDWNKNISDIDVAFFMDYDLGDNIDELSDFDPAEAQSLATDISTDLGL